MRSWYRPSNSSCIRDSSQSYLHDIWALSRSLKMHAVLRAPALGRSFVHARLAMFCTSATFTASAFPSPSPPCHVLCTSHIPSLAFLSHLPLPPRFSYAFLTALCPLRHICCLDTGLEGLPLVRLPFWRYRCNRLILYFPRAQKQSNLTFCTFFWMSRA
jgi:hypothetical protein